MSLISISLSRYDIDEFYISLVVMHDATLSIAKLYALFKKLLSDAQNNVSFET